MRGFLFYVIIVVEHTRHFNTVLTMMNSKTFEYYHPNCQNAYGYLSEYIAAKAKEDRRFNYILFFIVISSIIALISVTNPIFAYSPPQNSKIVLQENSIYQQKNFEENIKNKYHNDYITFPAKGVAHIKKTIWIKSKPIKINIVELNTNVNKNLKIKPEIAGTKLNKKTTVRKIAQKQGAIIAINGGFFKPQTGVPLGALMIDGEILTGPIYNRVGIAIFDDGSSFKMDNIKFDITAYNSAGTIKVDNINQPRMLSTYNLLYTSDWGEYSPIAPKNCYNMLIRNNKILKISANPIEMQQNDLVLSAPKGTIQNLAKNNKEIFIDIKLQESLKQAQHIIGAGPYLVKNSEIYTDYKAQKLEAISGKNPRSAIGYRNDGTFIIVTVDGREKASVGMTLYELAKLMKKIGCEYAMNFDGGSSSALYIKGKIVNSAINKEGIAVSNALLVSEEIENAMQISSL